jgi:polysaccharide biosynthesis/export protein
VSGFQPIAGDYLVRPDGTVGLGVWGSVRVAGLTTEKAADEIRRKLAAFTQVNGSSSRIETLAVTVALKASNSTVAYVITQARGKEEVHRLPLTGKETVLDAIASVPGLASIADRGTIHVFRMGPAGAVAQDLPVDWNAIFRRNDLRTNYQLMPGDRVYVTPAR